MSLILAHLIKQMIAKLIDRALKFVAHNKLLLLHWNDLNHNWIIIKITKLKLVILGPAVGYGQAVACQMS